MHGICNFYRIFFQKNQKSDLFSTFFSCQKWHINPEKAPKSRGPKILQNWPKNGRKLMFRSIKRCEKKGKNPGFSGPRGFWDIEKTSKKVRFMVNKPRSGQSVPGGGCSHPAVTPQSHVGHFLGVPKIPFFDVFMLHSVGFWGCFLTISYRRFSEISKIFG